MPSNQARSPRPARVADFELTTAEVRAVTAFTLACAEQVIDVFEAARPDDPRPREALEAAAAFVRGGPRSRAQRVTAPAAHRAANEVEPHAAAAYAAMAAGDAAASAYLHPLADEAQVGHILRGPAYTVLALRHRASDPAAPADAIAAVLRCATRPLVDVLGRYPRLSVRRQEVTAVMADLDAALRERPRP